MNKGPRKFVFHKAVEANNFKKVKGMLPFIRDINEKNECGESAFVKVCQLDNGDEIFDLIFAHDKLDPTLTNNKGFNALHCLAIKENFRGIQKLLEKYPNFDVNTGNDEGETAVMLASGKNYVRVIEYLHTKGADIKAKSRNLSTALHYAANGGHLEVAKKLIQLGADVNAENDEGHTPATIASYWGWTDICDILVSNGGRLDLKNVKKPRGYHLHEAVVHRNKEKLRVILNQTMDVNQRNDEGYTALILACDQEVNGDNEIIEMLLNQNEIDVTLGNNEGKTPLYFLACRGNLPAIKMLLKKWPNIDVDVECEKGKTPLQGATKMNHWEIIEFLVNKGADINHQNKTLFNAVLIAASNCAYEALIKVVELGGDMNAKNDYGHTALIKAASWNSLHICKYLIENGADVNESCKLNKHALIYAAKRGHVETVRLLLENGATPNQFGYVNENAPEKNCAALSDACFYNNLEVVKLLIKFRANVNSPKTFGVPLALRSCVYGGSFDCVVELLAAGVQVNQSILNFANKYQKMEIFELLQKHLLQKSHNTRN